MRKIFEECLKEELRSLALTTRAHMELTQREMADLLVMSESGYSDIETGTYMCGTLTAVLLLSMQDDPKLCLGEICEKFKKQYEKELEAV